MTGLEWAAMSRASVAPDSTPTYASGTLLAGAAALAMLLLAAAWLTRPGLNAFEHSQFISTLIVLMRDAPAVLGWLTAAWGFGSLLAGVLDRQDDSACPRRLELGAGVAAMLWLDHTLGAAGLLQFGGGVGAWALPAIGWFLAIHRLRTGRNVPSRSAGSIERAAAILLAAVPALALLLVAATSAPGWLWSSEGHGYDVLEYHLMQGREWLALGSLTPLAHNAYSFAPSYVEAAYYHLAILLDPFAARPADGAIQAATACQLLHAALMIWAAGEVALLASRYTMRFASFAAGAIAISVPWVVVTGSMAYNEAVLIGALALCWRLIEAGRASTRTLLLIGFLAGIACGAKLTALGSVALPVGVLLLVRSPIADWPRTILAAALGGIIALAPYLIRNFAALDGGNPFFPLFMDTLGSAHWTVEQMQRWNKAHAPDKEWIERFVSLWTMGFAHAQWAGLWLMAFLAAPIAWANPSRRTAAGHAILILALQLGFWLAMTHLQSRFLLPCLPPLVVLVGLAIDTIATRSRVLAIGMAAMVPIGLGGWSIHIFEQERGGKPATYIDGVPLRSGVDSPGFNQGFLRELALANSEVYLTHFTDASRGVYLLGDATPFYILRPVVWHTTWDASPLGEIIRVYGDDHRAWAAALIERGLPLVLVNEAELHRLGIIDGWYDPDVAASDWRGFFESHARPVMVWPITSEHRRVLYEIIPPR